MWGRGSHRLLLRCIGNASKHEGSRSAAGSGRLHMWVENGWERQMQSGAELIQAPQGSAVDKLGCSFAETRVGFSAGGRLGGGWRGGREQGVCIRLLTTGTEDPSLEAQHVETWVGSDEGHSAEVGVTAAVVEGSALDGGNLPVTAAGADEGSSREFEDLATTAAGAEDGPSSISDEDVPAPAAGEEGSSTDDVVGLHGDSASSGSLHAVLEDGTPTNAEDSTTSAELASMIAGTGQAVDSDDATGATLQSTPDDLLTKPEEQEISESEEAKQKMAELAEELNKSLEDFKKARSHTAKVYVHIKSFEKIRPGRLANVRSAGLPARRSLFTINRSPHVDKKARDQFQMKVHKHLLVIETETHKLHEKLHQLRNHDLPGVQLKVTFHYQTRLDMSKLA